MTTKERASCINTIELLRRLAFNVHGVMDVIDAENCEKIIAMLKEPETIRCNDCKHKPTTNNNYNSDDCDCGFNIEFPDYRCPCQCEDGYYNRLPDDDWFCGNAERRTDD